MLSQPQREKCGYQDAQEAAERHSGLYVNKQAQQGDCQQAEPETGDSLSEAGNQKYEKQKEIYRHKVQPKVVWKSEQLHRRYWEKEQAGIYLMFSIINLHLIRSGIRS